MYSRNKTARNVIRQIYFCSSSNVPANPPHMLYDRAQPTRIEGGDELVLSKHVLAIGIRKERMPFSIEQLAQAKCSKMSQAFEYVLAFDIGQEPQILFRYGIYNGRS